MRGDALDHESDVDHREERTDADDVPLPAPEKEVAAGDGKQHEQRIHPYLYLGERTLRHLTDGNGNALARHRHRAAPHLESDADAHDRAPRELGEQLRRQRHALQTRGQPHVEVDEPSEDETDDELEELHGVELPPQDQYLTQHQDEIHRDRVVADRPFGDTAYRSRQRKDERQRGDHAAAQRGFHAKNDSQRHKIQRTEQQQMLPKERYGSLFRRHSVSNPFLSIPAVRSGPCGRKRGRTCRAGFSVPPSGSRFRTAGPEKGRSAALRMRRRRL